MQHTKRLMGTLIHRHFTTNEIGTNGRNPDAKNLFNSVLKPVIHLDQVHRSLADVFVQTTATVQKKPAQAYHSSE